MSQFKDKPHINITKYSNIPDNLSLPKKGWGSSILTVGECGYHRGSLKRAGMNAKQGSIIWRPVGIKIGLGVNYLGIIVKRDIIRVTQQPFIQVTYRFKYQSSFVRALTWYIAHSYRRNQLLNNQWPSPLHFCVFTFMNSLRLYGLLSLTTLIILLLVAWNLYQNEW